MINKYARIYFWGGSIICTLTSISINILIIEWNKIHISLGIIYLFIQSLCIWASSEILLKALLVLFHKINKIKMINNIGKTSFIINYNLKANDEEEIDECFDNMYQAFIGNMAINSIAVLISVTNDPILISYESSKLIDYRETLYNHLYRSGLNYINNIDDNIQDNIDDNIQDNIDDNIQDNIDDNSIWWSKLNISKKLLKSKLHIICKKRSLDFILLRRNSKTLKKCGQYQDLICLSAGYSNCFTYEDSEIYGLNSRVNKALFIEPSCNKENYNRILRKNFKFTLVLDSDTRVPNGSVIKLIGTALANPEYTIIQPRIDLYGSNTIFQKLQIYSQEHSNIITKYTCSYFDHCPFFGKGLIRNSEYLKYCIGTSINPVEYVPADALSHDTFESMALPVLYNPNIALEETPPTTYITWNIRELRWNIGELIVARHIYPNLLCRQKKIPQTKHIYTLSFAKAYFALSSFRIIIMRPILLLYIIFIAFIPMRFSYIPMIYMVTTIIILPILITFKIKSFPKIILLLVTSIIQMTPEPAIGTIRLFISFYKLFRNNLKWIPSRTVEYNIYKRGIFYYAMFYLSPFMIIAAILFPFLYKINIALTFFLVANIILPFYTIITGQSYINYFNPMLYKRKPFHICVRKKRNVSPKHNITLAELALDNNSVNHSINIV